MIRITYTLLIALFVFACQPTEKELKNASSNVSVSPTNRAQLSSEIIWEKLNPARGDQSPQAGTIWGDRKGKVATGFLAKFVDGFSSPPHIHNVTYRAMVVDGLVHNDDPNAANMWMPPGSFWTQPAGESHITSAQGQSIAYVEIDHGPYLVKPVAEEFDNGEKPVNISKDNIVWLDHKESGMIYNEQVELAYLWQQNGLNGYLLKVKNGFKGSLTHHGDVFHAVIIKGEIRYMASNKNLDPGGYFTATEQSKHLLENAGGTEALVYIRTNDKIELN